MCCWLLPGARAGGGPFSLTSSRHCRVTRSTSKDNPSPPTGSPASSVLPDSPLNRVAVDRGSTRTRVQHMTRTLSSTWPSYDDTPYFLHIHFLCKSSSLSKKNALFSSREKKKKKTTVEKIQNGCLGGVLRGLICTGRTCVRRRDRPA